MTENEKKIKEYQNLLNMLSAEHFVCEEELENLHDDSEAGISMIENELSGIEDDMEMYVAEIKKLKATK